MQQSIRASMTRRAFLRHAFAAGAAAFLPGCVRTGRSTEPVSRRLITTLGPMSIDEIGMILPHEHVFVDLRTWDTPGYAQAATEDVIALMGPELERARAAGVTAIVECTPLGVGRRVDILAAVSKAVRFPLLVPTGVYREPWIPPWVHETSEDELCDWMFGEMEEQIEKTGVQAAWVKLSAGNAGITDTERKVLRAAARACRETNAVIGSHTARGSVALDQLDIIEGAGYRADRFIWIHAQIERSFDLNLEAARRGAWIEYDGIGGGKSDAFYLERIQRLLDADLQDRILLSMDRGWYDPAKPGGGTPKPFTCLSERFLPRLREGGMDEETIAALTKDNPFRAFSR